MWCGAQQMPRCEITPTMKAGPDWTHQPHQLCPVSSSWLFLGVTCAHPSIPLCALQGTAAPWEGAWERTWHDMATGSQHPWQVLHPLCAAELEACEEAELLNLKKKSPQKQYKAKDLHSPMPSNITMKWSDFAYLYSYSTRTCWIFITVTSLAPFCLFISSSVSVIWAFIALSWSQ